MAQQTAVEWLLQRLILNGTIRLTYTEHPVYKELSKQAKELEMEQMRKCASFWRGKENEIEKPIFDQYYTETYGK